jgi:two-component system, NtrC family, sensor kinase
MIRKYPWHFVFAIFVILSLANIFQKLRWSAPSDDIVWDDSDRGLVCISAPTNHPVASGDLLVTVNNYIIRDKTDLLRVIEQKKYCIYEIERQGILKNIGIDIINRFTPLSYYVLAFIGIVFILLSLGVLNIFNRRESFFSPPPVFFFLTLSFSGFLIFSPTGNYRLSDFLYLGLDNLSFLFFPSILLHYALQYPLHTTFDRKLPKRFRFYLFYLPPLIVALLNLSVIGYNIIKLNPDFLITAINHFRDIAQKFFAFYLVLALGVFIRSNLTLIVKKKQHRYLFPLIGVFIGLISLLVLNSIPFRPQARLSFPAALCSILLIFLPLSTVYFLSQKRFSDIENIIKKTLSISSLFIFIFGIYLFLGLNIEQNKILGVFWSIAAILMAGLLFKPVEATIQKYFEKIFYRETFNFKRKLKELEHSISSQRDLLSLSVNFLDIINKGFQLQTSSLIIHTKGSMFLLLPERIRLSLSRPFREEIINRDHLIFLSDQEFRIKYPKDGAILSHHRFFQFLPLITSGKLIGLVAFGRKTDNTYLSVEDWDLMSGISSSLSLSVENAFLYSRLETQLNELNLLTEFNTSIIENINLGLVVLSPANRIRTWNSFMEGKFGIGRDKTINKRASAILPPPIWEKIQGIHAESGIIHNLKILIADEEATFDVYLSPLKYLNQDLPGKIILFEDVTEKISIQNQLITSEKMASLGLLSAGVAHEINTPLTGISSYCQLLLSHPQGAEENREMILKIQDQVLRANKIIRTLLDFSRPKGEKAVEVDLNKIIEESLSLIEHKFKKKEIHVRKEFHFQKILFGFPTHLQQLFINLLLNAFDAIPHAGQISISGEETAGELMIRIKDNGRGIREKNLDKIFDPFFTTKSIGKGTGLGLSIAYNIVKEHYGTIAVHSKINKGTTFIMAFPIQSPLRSIKI